MPMLDWKHEPLCDAFKAFKARIELYFEDQEIPAEKQSTKLQIAVGDEGMRRILSSGLSADERKVAKNIFTLLESQLDATVKISFRVHRLEFQNMRQREEESITDFISRLREKSTPCNFRNDELNDRLIEMVILSTPIDDLRKELLSKDENFTIKETIELGRQYEAIIASQTSLQSMSASGTAKVDHIKQKTKCGNCGKSHPPKRCPAYYKECDGCGNIGHFKNMCRNSKPQNQNQQHQRQRSKSRRRGNRRKQRQFKTKTHEVNIPDDESSSASETEVFDAIDIADVTLHSIMKKEAFTMLDMHHAKTNVSGKLKLKIDTGAGGNTLPLRTFKQMFKDKPVKAIAQPEPTMKLTSYTGNEITCLGSVNLNVKKKSQSEYQTLKFYVVDVDGPAIIGLPSCKQLQLVTISVDAVKKKVQVPTTGDKVTGIAELKSKFPNNFDDIGCFSGEVKLRLKPDATPFIDPPRRFPIHIRPKIQEELDKMAEKGIIKEISHDTEWCSSLTYTVKKDGSLRICLDPQKLNNALQRFPHEIPTVEEITPAFSKAKYFSKFDAKAGYWACKIAPESQHLLTFRGPNGRKYQWLRLPFGLGISQDVFQKRVDKVTDQCDGCVGISDDIVVYGRTEEEHDRRVLHFMKVAEKEGLRLNSAKCVIKTNRISFFGRLYTDKGVFPDPSKVEDVVNMEVPTNKQELQTFLGLLSFLSCHIPNLSSQAACLRDLNKKDTVFIWTTEHQMAFDNLKQSVATNIGLQYYSPSDDNTFIEVDASGRGLGSCLIQSGTPVAFASKSLSPAQSKYSNVERECLAIVHGINRFHHYVYGRRFTVITDCKALEMLFKKPLHTAPPRLQRIMIKIQGYDFTVKYRKGETMVIADALSRLPNMAKSEEIEIFNEVKMADQEFVCIDLLRFSPARQEKMRQETKQDLALSNLCEIIISGWPEKIQDVPPELRECWTFRDELAVKNGIIFKGTQVLVPPPSRGDILKQLHASHQGITKTQLLARESVYWIGINKQIVKLCETCSLCQELLPKNTKEPLIMHEKPAHAWVKVGTDLFDIGSKSYLIISDYFSRFPVVKELPDSKSATVIEMTKEVLALFGNVREIVSDNGPCFQKAYDNFCATWDIKHTTSSPKYPSSNGFIERQIRYIKPIIKKCLKNGEDIHLALLNVRATPLDSKLPSPGELIFSRKMATVLPNHSMVSTKDQVHAGHMSDATEKCANYANAHRRQLPVLMKDQPVRILDNNTWKPGKIVAKSKEPRSYIVQCKDRHIRRNRAHIRPSKSVDYTPVESPTRNVVLNTPTKAPKCKKVTVKFAVDSKPDAILPPKVSRYGREIKAPVRL